MKSLAVLIAFVVLLSPALTAQTSSLLIEDMTWTEVRDAIAAGKTTAIYYAGSTEQNGPGMALGKHIFVAHYLATKIAAQLGNALVYPTCRLLPPETGVSPRRVGSFLRKRLATCALLAA